jgi:hypothetical protein
MSRMNDLSIHLEQDKSRATFESDIQTSLDNALANGYLTETEYDDASIDLVNEDYQYLRDSCGVLGDLLKARESAFFDRAIS